MKEIGAIMIINAKRDSLAAETIQDTNIRVVGNAAEIIIAPALRIAFGAIVFED